MNVPAEMRPSKAIVSAYERLRERIVEPHRRVNGALGLNILLRHGLLAWMRTYSPALIDTRTSPAPIDTTRVPSALRDDIIDVMVTMATSASRPLHQGAASA